MTLPLASFSPGYRRHVERHAAAIEDYARWLADRAGIDLAGLDLLALRYGYRDVPTGGRMPDGTPCTRRKRYLRGVVFGRLYDTGTLEPARREPVVTIIIPRKGA